MLDLFSGIGGFSLAAEWTGQIETVCFVEINKFCQKVLNKNFKGIPIHDDCITFTKEVFTKLTGLDKVDIITGGFPCQDISIAGIRNGRKGLQGNKSSLFYQMLRIIKEIKPTYFIFENSPHIRNYLKFIINQFREINYSVTGKNFTARQFGFPHKRERFYGIGVTHANSIRRNEVIVKNSIFEKINKSKEIFRLSKTNKAKFIRTLSPSLLGKTETRYVRVTDGISDKLDKDRVTALGNAVVPQIAHEIFKAIIEEEKYIDKYLKK